MAAIAELPEFFDPAAAASWSYRPDPAQLAVMAETWRQRCAIAPASEDQTRIELLLIDGQKDFCLPEGALFVAGRSGSGAVADTRRIAAFIYRQLARISRITVTLDTHFPFQIFFPGFWRDGAGQPPPPFTSITADDLRQRRWQLDPVAAQFAVVPEGRPDFAWAQRQAAFYAETLERTGKYSLTIWPYHCLLGGAGHALVGALQEARLFHSSVRRVQSPIEIKGDHPWTENYSVFGAEVRERWDGQGALTNKNEALIRRLIHNDAVVVAGQAASHCVMWSVDDLVREVRAIDPALVRKLYLLRDCTSSVVVFGADGTPVVDYTAATDAAFERWQGEGVNVVDSTTDLADWPGLTG